LGIVAAGGSFSTEVRSGLSEILQERQPGDDAGVLLDVVPGCRD
jgi:hypothetical protein